MRRAGRQEGPDSNRPGDNNPSGYYPVRPRPCPVARPPVVEGDEPPVTARCPSNADRPPRGPARWFHPTSRPDWGRPCKARRGCSSCSASPPPERSCGFKGNNPSLDHGALSLLMYGWLSFDKVKFHMKRWRPLAFPKGLVGLTVPHGAYRLSFFAQPWNRIPKS